MNHETNTCDRCTSSVPDEDTCWEMATPICPACWLEANPS